MTTFDKVFAIFAPILVGVNIYIATGSTYLGGAATLALYVVSPTFNRRADE